MGMPAYKLEPEVTVNERVTRLEANVEHIQADIAEMKVDIREIRHDVAALRGDTNQGFTQLRGEMHEGFTRIRGETHEGFTRIRGETHEGFTQIRTEMAAQRVETKDAIASIHTSLNSAKFWALGLYVALAATMFGVMAKGLGWL